jgi:hypothetical protein
MEAAQPFDAAESPYQHARLEHLSSPGAHHLALPEQMHERAADANCSLGKLVRELVSAILSR